MGVLFSNGFANCCALVLCLPDQKWGALVHLDIDGQKSAKTLREFLLKAIKKHLASVTDVTVAVFGSYHPRDAREQDAVELILGKCKEFKDFRKDSDNSWSGTDGNCSIYFRPGRLEVQTFG